MKKLVPAILLLGLMILTSGFSLKEWRSSLYDSIKSQAQSNFSALFNRTVSIESAGGWLVGRIELNNMTIPGLGRAEQVVLTYNPITYAFAKGDMIPALTKITVVNGNFKIERDKNGAFAILKAFSGGGASGGPPPFHGRVIIQNSSAEYIDHRGYKETPEYFYVAAQKVNGALDLRKKDVIKFSVSGHVPEFVKAQGSFDAAAKKYELNVSAEKLDLKKWANYTIPLPGFQALGGTADLTLRVSPPKTKSWAAAIVGRATFFDASTSIQGQKITGASGDLFFDDANLTFKDLSAKLEGVPLKINGRLFNLLLSADVVSRSFFGGNLSGHFDLDLQKAPRLTLAAKLAGLNLADLAQRAPGVEGKADGTIELAGPLNELKGKLSAQLSHGLVFGQPMESVSSTFRIVNNTFQLDDFTAAAGEVNFRAAGTITPDLVFDLRAEAAAFRLKGKGVFGEMTATLNSFKGRTHWKLDKEFLAQPLRNLTASGEVIISNGRIGDQLFDEASGGLSIGGGRIEITEARIKKDRSAIRLSGVTGLGTPTDLVVAADKIDLTDLKLANPFLPVEARNPTGSASFEIKVTGELSKETRIVSYDPLLDLTVDGRLQVSTAEIAGTAVSEASLKFNWRDRTISLSDCRIVTPVSRLSLNLIYKKDGSLEGSLEGTANLNDYQPLTSKYGKISGLAGLALNFGGSAASPRLAASFWLKNFGFNNIYFDDVSGSLGYSASKFTVLKPIIFKNGSDLYSLAGDLVVDPVSPEASRLGLNFQIIRADLASSYRLLYNIQGEVARRFFAARQVQPFSSINLAAFKLPDPSAFSYGGHLQLYLSEGPKPYYLTAWKKVWQQSEKIQAAAPEENLGGSMTAEVTLSGKVTALTGRLRGQISQGFFRGFRYDLFEAEAALKDGEIKIEKAVLSKSGGNIAALGSYRLNGDLAIRVTADKMPLDILQIVFPGKSFTGAFDLNASLGGSLESLTASLEARGNDLSLAGIDFDQAVINASQKDGSLYLNRLSLTQHGEQSFAHGSLQLSRPGQLSLEIDLQGNSLGLMNLFTDQVKWEKGSSKLYARVTGSLDAPKINGAVTVKDGTIYVKTLESELRNLQGTASVESGLLTINALTGIWTGKRTSDIANPVGLAGTIDLNNVLKENGSLYLNLAFSPTRVYASFPGLYVGTLDIKELSLQGPLNFDLSGGPLLKGKAEVSNAVITVAPPGGGRPSLPLRLALETNLAKNVYVVMGDIATLNWSNVLINLEVGGGLNIAGDLESPNLLGKIAIKRGTVNILNREFSLLTPEMLKKYSTYGSSIAQENTAYFKGEGTMPDIDVTASIDVDNQEKDASGKYVKQTVNILAHVTGTMGAKEEARGLKISLTGFSEDKTKSPPEFAPAAYSEQDLKVMLLPDFIKSLAGVGQPGANESPQTNAVIADYLSSRVQSLLFRSLEREAEQRLGLESLTLEYNLGPKIGEAMGVRDITGFDQTKPAWSVAFVKGFFDRIYISVRYAQGTDQVINSTAASQTNFDYELTYKLTPIWSIIYYQEPADVSQPNGYQKLTLAAGFSFW